MKKITIVLIFALCLPLFSCSQTNYRNDVAVDALAEKIKAALPLPYGYAEHDGDYLIYRFEDISEHVDGAAVVYSKDTKQADLFAVFHAKSARDVDEVEEICLEFIKDQRELFSSIVEQYMPSEESKLDAAEVRIFGNYAVLCVLSPSDLKVAFETVASALNFSQSP